MNFMDIKAWFLEKFGSGTPRAPAEVYVSELMGDLRARELAFWTCTNLIARAVSKCEFKTFWNGKEIKGQEYYLWNYSPNKNQSSSVFLGKLISQLYARNEALVVDVNGQLLVADSFIRKPYALYEDVFSQVQVDDFCFERSFLQSDVMFFTLSSVNMREVVNRMYNTYGKLIAYGMDNYQRSRGQRGVLEISTMARNAPDFQEKFNALMNERFKTFFKADNAVLPLFDGYKYTELGKKTYSNEGTRDIRAMINDVCDFTALAFQIPPALVSGDIQGTSDAVEQFLTFCIDPLTDLLAEEINRKRYGFDGIKKGNKIQIDTKAVKHVDLLSVASAVDKLISSGAFTINDIREVVGEPPVEEEWANRHFMTKNYETIESLLQALDGGGENK